MLAFGFKKLFSTPTYFYGGIAVRNFILLLGFSYLFFSCASTHAIARDKPLDEPAVIELREGLAIERVGRSGPAIGHAQGCRPRA